MDIPDNMYSHYEDGCEDDICLLTQILTNLIYEFKILQSGKKYSI
jgi:hypothetical protein